MGASAHDIPPSRERRLGRIGFRTTAEESLLIHKAAELQGCTVTQYVLCAVLDRAEAEGAGLRQVPEQVVAALAGDLDPALHQRGEELRPS